MAAEPASEIYMRTMCLCVPLRLGILIWSCFTLLTSLLYLFNKELFAIVFRHFTGGYALASRVAIGAIEVTGVVFALLGILGTWFVKKDYIMTFNLWQFARLAAWIWMYYVDIPLISRCEGWVDNIRYMTETHGWNKLMYDTAMNGRCESERVSFYILSFLTLFVFLYFIVATLRYQNLMNTIPKHLLRVPKDLAAGAFHSHSFGSRAHLNGTYGQKDYEPLYQQPPASFGSVPLGEPMAFGPADMGV